MYSGNIRIPKQGSILRTHSLDDRQLVGHQVLKITAGAQNLYLLEVQTFEVMEFTGALYKKREGLVGPVQVF